MSTTVKQLEELLRKKPRVHSMKDAILTCLADLSVEEATKISKASKEHVYTKGAKVPLRQLLHEFIGTSPVKFLTYSSYGDGKRILEKSSKYPLERIAKNLFYANMLEHTILAYLSDEDLKAILKQYGYEKSTQEIGSSEESDDTTPETQKRGSQVLHELLNRGLVEPEKFSDASAEYVRESIISKIPVEKLLPLALTVKSRRVYNTIAERLFGADIHFPAGSGSVRFDMEEKDSENSEATDASSEMAEESSTKSKEPKLDACVPSDFYKKLMASDSPYAVVSGINLCPDVSALSKFAKHSNVDVRIAAVSRVDSAHLKDFWKDPEAWVLRIVADRESPDNLKSFAATFSKSPILANDKHNDADDVFESIVTRCPANQILDIVEPVFSKATASYRAPKIISARIPDKDVPRYLKLIEDNSKAVPNHNYESNLISCARRMDPDFALSLAKPRLEKMIKATEPAKPGTVKPKTRHRGYGDDPYYNSMLSDLLEKGPIEVAAYVFKRTEGIGRLKKLRARAEKRLENHEIKRKTQSLKEESHKVPSVPRAVIEKLEEKLSTLTGDSFKWGPFQKHFGFPQDVPKEVRPMFLKLNASGSVKREAVETMISDLKQEAKTYDIGFSEYGNTQTMRLTERMKVIQLNINDEMKQDLIKRFGPELARQFMQYMKGIGNLSSGHPIVKGRTAAWARIAVLPKLSTVIVEEIQSDLFNPQLLDHWLREQAGEDVDDFDENEEDEAAQERLRDDALDEDETAHQQTVVKKEKKPLSKEQVATKNAVYKVLAYFHDWTKAIIAAIRRYAASLEAKHIMMVNKAIKIVGIQTWADRNHDGPGRRRVPTRHHNAPVPHTRLEEMYEKVPAEFGFKPLPLAKIRKISPEIAESVKAHDSKFIWYIDTPNLKVAMRVAGLRSSLLDLAKRIGKS